MFFTSATPVPNYCTYCGKTEPTINKCIKCGVATSSNVPPNNFFANSLTYGDKFPNYCTQCGAREPCSNHVKYGNPPQYFTNGSQFNVNTSPDFLNPFGQIVTKETFFAPSTNASLYGPPKVTPYIDPKRYESGDSISSTVMSLLGVSPTIVTPTNENVKVGYIPVFYKSQ
jgi:hypothetical protein